MDRGGIEPPTSCLRSRRSPKLSYRPNIKKIIGVYIIKTSLFSQEFIPF